MPPNAGYIEQATTPALAATFVGILLTKNELDVRSVLLPGGNVELSHIEFICGLDTTGNGRNVSVVGFCRR